MQLAATTRSITGLSAKEVCDVLDDLGYDRIELCLNDAGQAWKASEVGTAPEAFAARFRETTRLSAAAIYLEHDVDRAVFRGITRFAKFLKIMQVTVTASPLGAPYNTEIDRLKDLIDIAGSEGIRVSLKTESGTLTGDPHTAIELCRAVKDLGLTLDPSYYICGTTRPINYEMVLPYVLHVHLRDTSKSELQVPAGLGEIDYNRLIGLLQRVNYNQLLSVDLLPGAFPEVETRNLEFRKLRMLLESLL